MAELVSNVDKVQSMTRRSSPHDARSVSVQPVLTKGRKTGEAMEVITPL